VSQARAVALASAPENFGSLLRGPKAGTLHQNVIRTSQLQPRGMTLVARRSRALVARLAARFGVKNARGRRDPTRLGTKVARAAISSGCCGEARARRPHHCGFLSPTLTHHATHARASLLSLSPSLSLSLPLLASCCGAFSLVVYCLLGAFTIR